MILLVMDSFPLEAVMNTASFVCSWELCFLKVYSEEEKKMKPVLCEKKTYTVAEIAKILGVSKGAAYSLVKENTFKSIKIGKSIRINKESFDKWFYSEE